MKRRAPTSCSGYSLVELLVASACLTVVVMGAMMMVKNITNHSAVLLSQATVQGTMETFLADVAKQFSRRLSPGPGDPVPFELRNSTGFFPTGSLNCQDLLIRQRASNGQIRSTLFSSACGAPLPVPYNSVGIAPQSACAGQATVLSVSKFIWPNDLAANPPLSKSAVSFDTAMLSVALCFRSDGGTPIRTISAELSVLYRGGTIPRVTSARVMLPLNEKNNAIEVLPN